MRLLNTTSIELTEFHGESIPNYAILSHTWGLEEVSFQALSKEESKALKGYSKITECCREMKSRGYEYVWIDTCCIDKTSSAELSEAINSMWRWYEESAVCIVYLEDVAISAKEKTGKFKQLSPSLKSDIQSSRWFRRGWTLQELLAPRTIIFVDRSWRQIGGKGDISGIMKTISQAAGIHSNDLEQPREACAAVKMSWASRRQTTRPEDIAYCLLGLFNVFMPLLYGEGLNAFRRLQEEIVKSSNDETIFAWADDSLIESGMFAQSPAAFAKSGSIRRWNKASLRKAPYAVTNFGLQFSTELFPWQSVDQYFFANSESESRLEEVAFPLSCQDERSQLKPLMIILRRHGDSFSRLNITEPRPLVLPCNLLSQGMEGDETSRPLQTIYIQKPYPFNLTRRQRFSLTLRLYDNFRTKLKYTGIGHTSVVPFYPNEYSIVFIQSAQQPVTACFTYWNGVQRIFNLILTFTKNRGLQQRQSGAMYSEGYKGLTVHCFMIFNVNQPYQTTPCSEDSKAQEFAGSHNLQSQGDVTLVTLNDDLALCAALTEEQADENRFLIDLDLNDRILGLPEMPSQAKILTLDRRESKSSDCYRSFELLPKSSFDPPK